MKCTYAMLLIEKIVRETLPDKKIPTVERHLAECADCRTYREILEEMIDALQELKKGRDMT
ncbi:MAG: hypothetical protein ACOYI2_07595 [Bacillota bacterium]|nr:hypothetical protein [Clostridia bacterium]